MLKYNTGTLLCWMIFQKAAQNFDLVLPKCVYDEWFHTLLYDYWTIMH
jgi:hypothetical protein